MHAPFTAQQFMGVFQQYNQAIWPMQVVTCLMAVVALATALWPRRATHRVPPLMLAAFWIWTGAVYHIQYFRAINPAAVAFGVLFIVQGGLFIWSGIIHSKLDLRFRPGLAGCVGGLIIAYALVLYPVLGHWLGHRFPGMPTFGVTPCPTVIFTFGLLLWSDHKLPRYLLVVPSLWALIGFSAAVQFGMYEDWGLLAAAALADLLFFLPIHPRRSPRFATS